MAKDGNDPVIIGPSNDPAVDVRVSIRDKGRNFDRMLLKERIMAMFDLYYNTNKIPQHYNTFLTIINAYDPDQGLDEIQVAALQAMGFLYHKIALEQFLTQIQDHARDAHGNYDVRRGLLIAIIQNAYFEMISYQNERIKNNKNPHTEFYALHTILEKCARIVLSLPADQQISPSHIEALMKHMQNNVQSPAFVGRSINMEWYAVEAGKNQSRKAQEKSMNVRMHYFIHQGLDVPEPLKKDFVRYIQRINPHTNIKKVDDIDWVTVKEEKKITAPIVSMREQEASEDNVQTTQIRASDIGVTQEQVLMLINKPRSAIINLNLSDPTDPRHDPDNPCNGKPNPLYNRRITSKDGETYLIDAEPGEDGQIHFKKHLITVVNGTETIHEEFLDLTVSDVEIKVNYFGKPQTLKEALADSFNHYAYFEPGPPELIDIIKPAEDFDLPWNIKSKPRPPQPIKEIKVDTLMPDTGSDVVASEKLPKDDEPPEFEDPGKTADPKSVVPPAGDFGKALTRVVDHLPDVVVLLQIAINEATGEKGMDLTRIDVAKNSQNESPKTHSPGQNAAIVSEGYQSTNVREEMKRMQQDKNKIAVKALEAFANDHVFPTLRAQDKNGISQLYEGRTGTCLDEAHQKEKNTTGVPLYCTETTISNKPGYALNTHSVPTTELTKMAQGARNYEILKGFILAVDNAYKVKEEAYKAGHNANPPDEEESKQLFNAVVVAEIARLQGPVEPDNPASKPDPNKVAMSKIIANKLHLAIENDKARAEKEKTLYQTPEPKRMKELKPAGSPSSVGSKGTDTAQKALQNKLGAQQATSQTGSSPSNTNNNASGSATPSKVTPPKPPLKPT